MVYLSSIKLIKLINNNANDLNLIPNSFSHLNIILAS